MTGPELPRDELRAVLRARDDLGPEYHAAITESFLEKVDQTIEARVNARVDERLADRPADPGGGVALSWPLALAGFLATGVIAGTMRSDGVDAIIVIWIAIAVINIVGIATARPRRRG